MYSLWDCKDITNKRVYSTVDRGRIKRYFSFSPNDVGKLLWLINHLLCFKKFKVNCRETPPVKRHKFTVRIKIRSSRFSSPRHLTYEWLIKFELIMERIRGVGKEEYRYGRCESEFCIIVNRVRFCLQSSKTLSLCDLSPYRNISFVNCAWSTKKL